VREGRNLVLIGFMGAGKSSVAAALGRVTGRVVIETDALALARSGRSSIAEVFALDGEAVFRAHERAAVAEAGAGRNSIIATGGGVILDPANIEALRAGGVIVCLAVSFEVARTRLMSDDTRPLMRDIARAQALFEQRRPRYEQAAEVTVATDTRSVIEVAGEVLRQLGGVPAGSG